MKLIVGLGNPGPKYENTRHNTGFRFLEALRLHLGVEDFSEKVKFQAELTLFGDSLILARPLTFMNQSGVAVNLIASFYKIAPSDIYIVHDDLDIPLGSYKLQKGVSPKVHNGIQSVNESLGTVDYWRLRLGIDARQSDNRIPGESYVLSNFLSEEGEVIKGVFSKSMELLVSEIKNEQNG